MVVWYSPTRPHGLRHKQIPVAAGLTDGQARREEPLFVSNLVAQSGRPGREAAD
ncbi:hypothetical protein GFS60_03001 [Rhodococcus sp. WAY2]|nr:hypothetical protein GFS60_03001 [Rhodococcus sp. WAY2]